MLGAVFRGKGQLQLEEVPLREPDANEVVIAVDSATICATDIHILRGNQPADPPVILGHEFSGIVQRVGAAVRHVRPGDAVTVEPHKYCGCCKFCRTGREHMCLNKKAYGVHLDGGFAQYAVVPDFAVYRVPEGVPLEEAALCENIGCCLHGIDRLQLRGGESVVILGGGFVGMMLAQLCKLFGCGDLLVSEPQAERRKMLLEHGADVAVDPVHEDLMETVMQLTDGLGADVVIEAAGRLETAQIAHTFAGRAGKVMYYGLVPPGQTLTLEPNEIFRKELTIYGSAINPNTHQRVLALLPRLRLDGCITHRFPLTQVDQAFAAARSGQSIKVCIKPNPA